MRLTLGALTPMQRVKPLEIIGVRSRAPCIVAHILAASACWGAAACIERSTARTEDPYTIVPWTTLIIAVFSFPPAALVWTWPSTTEALMLFVTGLLSAIGTLAWTNASSMARPRW
ncbi:hypothetical protein [Pararhizobium gei]|uniref:hypothetical protein n=1 Tax=Pararhizobium gei TaxID=1395951 RepID=UPI003D9C6F4B